MGQLRIFISINDQGGDPQNAHMLVTTVHCEQQENGMWLAEGIEPTPVPVFGQGRGVSQLEACLNYIKARFGYPES